VDRNQELSLLQDQLNVLEQMIDEAKRYHGALEEIASSYKLPKKLYRAFGLFRHSLTNSLIVIVYNIFKPFENGELSISAVIKQMTKCRQATADINDEEFCEKLAQKLSVIHNSQSAEVQLENKKKKFLKTETFQRIRQARNKHIGHVDWDATNGEEIEISPGEVRFWLNWASEFCEIVYESFLPGQRKNTNSDREKVINEHIENLKLLINTAIAYQPQEEASV